MQYKILVVEDDEDTANIGAISLKQLGFQVEMVYHGDEAIPKMKSWAPDIVILDLELPGKNGSQILQEMLVDPVLSKLIIVANTVHMDAKDDLGFSYYTNFVRVKNQEPVMINKLAQDENKQLDMRHVIINMMREKFGHIPKELEDWALKHSETN